MCVCVFVSLCVSTETDKSHTHLVIASDGVWDHLSNDEVFFFLSFMFLVTSSCIFFYKKFNFFINIKTLTFFIYFVTSSSPVTGFGTILSIDR